MRKMNKHKILIKGILSLFIVFTLGSCERWIDTDINVDPDNPTDVPMEFLLPNIQANMAYDLGGNDLVRTTNIWMQYFNGFARQSLAEARYSLRPSDPNNLWNSCYAVTLSDLNVMLEKAEETNSPHFKGVAQVLVATTLGHITDVWGDIPYSEAFQGTEELSPALDTQEEIYNTIQTMLDEAITNLQASENVVAVASDPIYGADLSLWVKAAYSLKARYAMNLTKVQTVDYTEVLGYVSNGFASSADNFQFMFGEPTQENSPLYQFLDQRGDISVATTFVDMLKTSSDPRISYYVTDDNESGDYEGGAPGSEDESADLPGSYCASKTAPTRFMTYAELKFIEAEANFRAGNTNAAYNAYLNANIASVYDVTGDTTDIRTTTWFDNINVGTSSFSLEHIMNQKYLATYAQLQPFNDWRRTGYPDLEPAQNAGDQIPRRYPYSQEELSYNENVNEVSIFSRVWWDAE
jgi:hypothetical protein